MRASEGLAVAPEATDGTMLGCRTRFAGGFRITNYAAMRRAWADAVAGSGIVRPYPVLHGLRHTHAPKLIADGWDPVEVSNRLGDLTTTILQTDAHEFDARRRSAERQAALESMYGKMATSTPSQAITPESEKLIFIGFPDWPAHPGLPLA